MASRALHVHMHAFIKTFLIIDLFRSVAAMLALLFLLINMPLLVSTKVVSRQDLSTKLLRDWRIISISDEVANHLDVLGLFNRIKDHKFDEHEPLALN